MDLSPHLLYRVIPLLYTDTCPYPSHSSPGSLLSPFGTSLVSSHNEDTSDLYEWLTITCVLPTGP